MKKVVAIISIVIVLCLIAVGIIMKTSDKKEEKKKEKKEEVKLETIVIDYKNYLELRSEAYENETFAIIIMNTDDSISLDFKKEVLNSFKGLNSKVYELDFNSLSETEYSGVIDDMTKVFKYDKPTIIIPSLIVSKKGKIVYSHAGLIYSPEIKENLDKQKIE